MQIFGAVPRDSILNKNNNIASMVIGSGYERLKRRMEDKNKISRDCHIKLKTVTTYSHPQP